MCRSIWDCLTVREPDAFYEFSQNSVSAFGSRQAGDIRKITGKR